MAEDRVDPISAALAQVMQAMSASATNPEISTACYGMLVAANELLCLRHDETLTHHSRRYLVSALNWSEKAQATIEQLLEALARTGA